MFLVFYLFFSCICYFFLFLYFFFFFFLMIRRPPRSTPLSLHDALPISDRGCDDPDRPPRRVLGPGEGDRGATWTSRADPGPRRRRERSSHDPVRAKGPSEPSR